MLSDLDGFLTGIAGTPVPVANWADVAFGAGVSVPPRIMQLTQKRLDDIKLNTVHWDKFAQSTTGAKLLMPILVHMFDDNGSSVFGIAQEDIDQTLAAAADAIPQTVPLIYREMQKLG